MADSARWCETHKTWGDHHTDRCPLTFDVKSTEEHEWDMVQAQRRAMGHEPKPYPPTFGAAALSAAEAGGKRALWPFILWGLLILAVLVTTLIAGA